MRYSVIIPVYNRPDEVDELLQSLTMQHFKDFEVVVVEDGSSIPCKEVVDRYADRLNIKYFSKLNSGLTKPTSGEILFKEHPWFYGDKAEIAYMSTEPFFYSFLDVNGVGQYYKDFFPDFDEKKFHEMVRRMSLEGKMKVKELSTGMTAKLKVIATLSRKAELYLLDEPFNGIDYKAKEEILGMILESANEKNTFVISTHMIDEIESFIDEAIFIKDGEVVRRMSVEEERMQSGKSVADIYLEIM